jgi:hypothetical protein
MKVTLESTTTIVELETNGQSIPARLWQGKTEKGIPCHCFIPLITPTIPRDRLTPQDSEEFERDLREAHAEPVLEIRSIPLRFIL